MTYTLRDRHDQPYQSDLPGTLGGNRKDKLYGRLDCGSAVRNLPRGYATIRVFFADRETAVAAGYRPCGTCLRTEHRAWKAQQAGPGPAS